MLYLDKMWPDFQQLTAPDGREHPRPCHRMFEGEVIYCADEGWSCWHPWVRAIAPDETGATARAAGQGRGLVYMIG